MNINQIIKIPPELKKEIIYYLTWLGIILFLAGAISVMKYNGAMPVVS